MSKFGDTYLGQGLAVAVILLAMLLGIGFIAKACGDTATACAEAGGSYGGIENGGSCKVER